MTTPPLLTAHVDTTDANPLLVDVGGYSGRTGVAVILRIDPQSELLRMAQAIATAGSGRMRVILAPGVAREHAQAVERLAAEIDSENAEIFTRLQAAADAYSTSGTIVDAASLDAELAETATKATGTMQELLTAQLEDTQPPDHTWASVTDLLATVAALRAALGMTPTPTGTAVYKQWRADNAARIDELRAATPAADAPTEHARGWPVTYAAITIGTRGTAVHTGRWLRAIGGYVPLCDTDGDSITLSDEAVTCRICLTTYPHPSQVASTSHDRRRVPTSRQPTIDRSTVEAVVDMDDLAALNDDFHRRMAARVVAMLNRHGVKVSGE
ncbi:MAG: hypothetical protein EPO06_11905 [Burkholderiaceae bacterium]|nr:MAG: hypothetical protein EPO06_11905 [Burkholderiaceae bacterium]